MLINSSAGTGLNFETIHNYYEPLVIEEIMRTLVAEKRIDDQDFLEDVACVALNSLPARYVRYDVDMAFFLSTEERREMADSISTAVADAAELVTKHRDEKHSRRYVGGKE